MNRNDEQHAHNEYVPMPPDDVHSDDDGNDDDGQSRHRTASRSTRTSTVLGTLSSMTMGATVVTIYGLNHSINSSDSMSTSSRHLLEEGTSNVSGTLLLVGQIMGWCCAAIYIVSRIPQLKLMMKTRDVSGINPAFFCLTFTGNFSQFLSMIIKKDIYHSKSALMSKLPWICDTGGCILQDGCKLFTTTIILRSDFGFHCSVVVNNLHRPSLIHSYHILAHHV